MSLGFAVAHEQTIFMAIESAGTTSPMGPAMEVLDSKLIELQEGIAVLATGWLINWLHVKHQYEPKASVAEAAEEATRLLKESVADHPLDPFAFGLVCGFQGETPSIFRISADRDQPGEFDCNAANPFQIQPIGEWHRVSAEQRARLNTSDPSKIEVMKAVLEEIPIEENKIVHPVHCKVILSPEYGHDVEPFRVAIRRLAFLKYLGEQRPDGRHLSHWLDAKSELGFSSYPFI